jgi:hypothetical protein
MSQRLSQRQKYLVKLAALLAGTILPVAAIAAPAQSAVAGHGGVSKNAQDYVNAQADHVVPQGDICWARFGQWVQGMCTPAAQVKQPGKQLPDLKKLVRDVKAREDH